MIAFVRLPSCYKMVYSGGGGQRRAFLKHRGEVEDFRSRTFCIAVPRQKGKKSEPKKKTAFALQTKGATG